MLKTVYSALAVTALLAGTASFAADQTAAPAATPVAATATAATSAAAPAVTQAKETAKTTHHVVKAKAKEVGAPATEAATSSTPKK